MYRYYVAFMVGFAGHLERGLYLDSVHEFRTAIRKMHQVRLKRQTEPPGPHDAHLLTNVRTCLWVIHPVLIKGAILSCQERCPMFEDVNLSGPPYLKGWFETQPEPLPQSAGDFPTFQGLLSCITLLGKLTTYSDGGIKDTVVNRHCLPLIPVPQEEFMDVKQEHHRSAANAIDWNHVHPTWPRPAYRSPYEERFLARTLETPWAMDLYRTQTEYALYQLVCDKGLASLGIDRCWGIPLRHLGADGDSLHLRIVESYRCNQHTLPVNALVSRHAVKDWGLRLCGS